MRQINLNTVLTLFNLFILVIPLLGGAFLFYETQESFNTILLTYAGILVYALVVSRVITRILQKPLSTVLGAADQLKINPQLQLPSQGIPIAELDQLMAAIQKLAQGMDEKKSAAAPVFSTSFP